VVKKGTWRLKIGLGMKDGAEGDGGGISLPGVLGRGEEEQGDRDREVASVLVQACRWHQWVKDGGLGPKCGPRVEDEGEGGCCGGQQRREGGKQGWGEPEAVSWGWRPRTGRQWRIWSFNL